MVGRQVLFFPFKRIWVSAPLFGQGDIGPNEKTYPTWAPGGMNCSPKRSRSQGLGLGMWWIDWCWGWRLFCTKQSGGLLMSECWLTFWNDVAMEAQKISKGWCPKFGSFCWEEVWEESLIVVLVEVFFSWGVGVSPKLNAWSKETTGRKALVEKITLRLHYQRFPLHIVG